MNKKRWYEQWWAPSAISFVLGFLLLIASFFLSITIQSRWVTASFALLITSAVFTLSWLLKQQQQEAVSQVREGSRSMGETLKNELATLTRSPAIGYLCYLRDRLLRDAQNAARQLISQDRSLKDVLECTAALTRCINDIPANGELLAVCGQKPWGDPLVVAYYKANYDGSDPAGKNIKVKRIFIENPAVRLSNEEQNIIRDHIDTKYCNVEGRVISSCDYSAVADINIPTGFGFAILGNSVIVHWGLIRNMPEAGRKLDHPLLVRLHREIFSSLWEVAKGKTQAEREEIWTKVLNLALPIES